MRVPRIVYGVLSVLGYEIYTPLVTCMEIRQCECTGRTKKGNNRLEACMENAQCHHWPIKSQLGAINFLLVSCILTIRTFYIESSNSKVPTTYDDEFYIQLLFPLRDCVSTFSLPRRRFLIILGTASPPCGPRGSSTAGTFLQLTMTHVCQRRLPLGLS